MYYLMTRYYDPKTGRFINADSYKYLDPDSINGLNLYAYCRNNPIMYFDPTGQFIEIIMASAIIMFVFAIGMAIVGVIVGAIKAAAKAIDEAVGPIVKEGVIKFGEIMEDVLRFLFDDGNADGTADAAEGAVDAAQNSSHIIDICDTFGGSGADFENAIKEEYGVDWD